jgi:hypothetical protein
VHVGLQEEVPVAVAVAVVAVAEAVVEALALAPMLLGVGVMEGQDKPGGQSRGRKPYEAESLKLR